MTTATHTAPAELNDALLRDPVRRATGSPTAEVVTWRCDRLGYAEINPVSGGLYRLDGTACSGPGVLPWTMVLKILRSPAAVDEQGVDVFSAPSDDPAHWNYWRREALTYRSGVLDDLSGDLRAPRCYGVEERLDGTVWLWLEDLGADKSPWPLERYGLAARHLGAFQGSYLAGRPLQDAAWLSHGWLRSWSASIEQVTQTMTLGEAPWEHPNVHRAFGRPVASAVQRLVEEQAVWLDALDGLPQTLCHFDFFRGNLVARHGADGHEQTVVLDWADIGHGPVGEDASSLVAGALLRLEVPATDVRRLEQFVFDGYLAGLRDAGWAGDERVIRLGFTMSAVVHWALGAAANTLSLARDESGHAAMEQTFGHSAAALLPQWVAMTCWLLELADETRDLLG